MNNYSTSKNLYDLQYNTYLTLFNVIIVGLVALWIAVFVQSSINLSYKLLISALIIFSSMVLYYITKPLSSPRLKRRGLCGFWDAQKSKTRLPIATYSSMWFSISDINKDVKRKISSLVNVTITKDE